MANLHSEWKYEAIVKMKESGLTHRQISAEIGVSVNCVTDTLHRRAPHLLSAWAKSGARHTRRKTDINDFAGAHYTDVSAPYKAPPYIPPVTGTDNIRPLPLSALMSGKAVAKIKREPYKSNMPGHCDE